MAAHARAQDDVQGAVGVAVAASVEAVADRFAAGGFQCADSAEFGEGGVAADPVGVVADRGQQRGGGGRADTIDGAQRRCGDNADGVDVAFQPGGATYTSTWCDHRRTSTADVRLERGPA